jgi:hypothetical protein
LINQTSNQQQLATTTTKGANHGTASNPNRLTGSISDEFCKRSGIPEGTARLRIAEGEIPIMPKATAKERIE